MLIKLMLQVGAMTVLLWSGVMVNFHVMSDALISVGAFKSKIMSILTNTWIVLNLGYRDDDKIH